MTVFRHVAVQAMVMLAGVSVSAQAGNYVSSFGDEYNITLNTNGAALISLYPKAWFIEGGANSRVERGIDTLYFGKSCDAFHKLWGDGTWWWANGGFGADFEEFSSRFPRQEIDVPGSNCPLR